MKSRQNKIERRRAKRKQKQATKRDQQRRTDVLKRFPEVVYRNEGASASLFHQVQKAMREVVREHPKLLGQPASELIYEGKQVGFGALWRRLAAGGMIQASNFDMFVCFKALLGTIVFERVCEAIGDSWLPYENVQVLLGEPQVNQILVLCRGLRTVKTSGGTLTVGEGRTTPKGLF